VEVPKFYLAESCRKGTTTLRNCVRKLRRVRLQCDPSPQQRRVKIPAASSGAFRAGGHCADLARSASTCPSKESICYIGGICPPNPLTRMPFLPTASSGASWHDFVKIATHVRFGNAYGRHSSLTLPQQESTQRLQQRTWARAPWESGRRTVK